MLEDLTPDQRRLAEAMSDLSEQTYCAGWMKNLEYGLWAALLGVADTHHLHFELSAAERAQLQRLSDACGGWIVFDASAGETWLPRAEWASMFAAGRD
jgi:hypothetical protein